jgi:IstB-like ATP binding protein
MPSNRQLEEWGKLLGDVPRAGAILDRFLRHAQTIAHGSHDGSVESIEIKSSNEKSD